MKTRSFFSNKAFRLIVVVILMFPLLANQTGKPNLVGPTRIYVDRDASGANNGTSWTDAFEYLQDALDETNASGSTDYEIWVADGVYYPDEDSDGDHTNNSYFESFRFLYDNVKVYGGFSGVETLRTQRDWENNLTILSGDMLGDDTNTDGNNIAEYWDHQTPPNIIHVVEFNGHVNEELTSYTVLDGFIITAGSASLSGTNSYGGGVYCYSAGSPLPAGVCSPTWRNLIIQGNKAAYGGGVMLFTNDDGVSNPNITNTLFFGNYASGDGGGFYSWVGNNAAGESIPVLVNVKFQENYSIGDGGGIYIYSNKGTNGPKLTNVEFYDNTATSEGGGIFSFGEQGDINAVLTNVTFSMNTADQGGAMYNRLVNTTSYVFAMEIYNSILWNNSGLTADPEIHNNGTEPEIAYSDIEGCGGSGLASWVTACGVDFGGNIDEAPLFVNPGAGDLTLQISSPAIDAGNQTFLPTDVTDLDLDSDFGETIPLDLAMNNRVQNAEVDMGAYEYPEIDSIGFWNPNKSKWYLQYENSGGDADNVFKFGPVGVGWTPITGDWDDDGVDTIGYWNPVKSKWYLKNDNSGGAEDVVFVFGPVGVGWTPIIGDWDGNGSDTIGYWNPNKSKWYLKNDNSGGAEDVVFVFGPVGVGWEPIIGDWDGDNEDTIGFYNPNKSKWYLKNDNSGGDADTVFYFGPVGVGWEVLTGDWQ